MIDTKDWLTDWLIDWFSCFLLVDWSLGRWIDWVSEWSIDWWLFDGCSIGPFSFLCRTVNSGILTSLQVGGCSWWPGRHKIRHAGSLFATGCDVERVVPFDARVREEWTETSGARDGVAFCLHALYDYSCPVIILVFLIGQRFSYVCLFRFSPSVFQFLMCLFFDEWV